MDTKKLYASLRTSKSGKKEATSLETKESRLYRSVWSRGVLFLQKKTPLRDPDKVAKEENAGEKEKS